MIPTETIYPIHLRTMDGKHYYRIEAADGFAEIQVVGTKALLHRVHAKQYPERLRIMDMVQNGQGLFLPSDAGEWERLLQRFGLRGQ